MILAGVTLAAEYAGFSRGKVTDNEMAHPGYGVTVAYHGGERGEATVYVYNKGQQDIADGPSSETVRAEFDQATGEALQVGQLTGKKTELVSQYGQDRPSGERNFCAPKSLSVMISEHSGRFSTYPARAEAS